MVSAAEVLMFVVENRHLDDGTVGVHGKFKVRRLLDCKHDNAMRRDDSCRKQRMSLESNDQPPHC